MGSDRKDITVTEENTECDHGVTFDQEAASRLLENWEPSDAVSFVMGNPASAEVRKRWPRLCGE